MMRPRAHFFNQKRTLKTLKVTVGKHFEKG